MKLRKITINFKIWSNATKTLYVSEPGKSIFLVRGNPRYYFRADQLKYSGDIISTNELKNPYYLHVFSEFIRDLP